MKRPFIALYAVGLPIALFFCAGCADDAAFSAAKGGDATTEGEADDFLKPLPTQEQRGVFAENVADLAVDPPAPAPDAGSAATEPADRTGTNVVGSLRRFIESSQALGSQEDVQGGLVEMLTEAEDQFERVRRENYAAIERINRQLRVGAAALSPSVILVQAERAAPDDWGCYGGEDTPFIDALSRSGVRFENFYTGSSDLRHARWCLATGRHGGRAVPPPPNSIYAGERQQLATMLWKAGYETAFVGLWDDSRSPLDCGYDEFAGFPTRNSVSPYPEKVTVDAATLKILSNEGSLTGVHCDEILTRETISFLQRAPGARRQFFLHVVLPALPTSSTPGDATASDVVRLDRFVGALSDALDRNQLTPRTALFVSAISGKAPPRTETSEQAIPEMYGMGDINLRIPMVVSRPGTYGAQVDRNLYGVWDLLATFADLAVVSRRPLAPDSVSLVPILRRGSPPPRKLLYWRNADGSAQAVRLGDWKGFHAADRTGVALFHLVDDPSEHSNVAADHPDVVRQMLAP